ncbi:MAG: SRPBCC family protein [Candidatus Nitrosomaritimum yanchengensis]
MKISQSIQIKDSAEKIWNTLSAFDGVERYLPIVTRSEVDGNGPGAKRTCTVSMGNQEFEMCESLQSLDDENYFMTVKLLDGPIQLRGMTFTYKVIKIDDNKSDLVIFTDVENPDAGSMAKSFFALIGQGLKKFHEL